MHELILTIPAEVANAIRLPRNERPTRLRRELAVRLYQKDLLTFGQARKLAGMTKWAFRDLLTDEGIHVSYDVEELKVDLETLETLS